MNRASDSLPFVSVIIPVYNDPEGIRSTLKSLSHQTYPNNRHEIIVVDNGSQDETRDIIHHYCDQISTVQMAVEDQIQSSYAARNKGIQKAQGSILAFLDADMSVPKDWLIKGVQAMTDLEADYMGCKVQVYYDQESEPLASKYNRLTAFQVERYITDLQFVPTCCLFVRASLIDEIGSFDSRLTSGGDAEFGHRVAESGREIHFASDIVAYHPSRRSFRALIQKSIRIGQGIYQRRQYYPERYGSPIRGLLDPKRYLPVRRITMRSTVRGWTDLSRREQVIFYVIHYVLRLCTAFGQLQEAIQTVTPNPSSLK